MWNEDAVIKLATVGEGKSVWIALKLADKKKWIESGDQGKRREERELKKKIIEIKFLRIRQIREKNKMIEKVKWS